MTETLDGSLFGPDQPCFACGPAHPIGFRLAFEVSEDEVRTTFTPGERYQGPPGIMHGGLVMTLADEVAAWSCIGLLGKFGFTTHVEGRLAKAARIGVPIDGRSWVKKDARRIVDVGVELSQEGDAVFAGTLRFVVMDKAGAERMIGRPLDDAWGRFAR